MPYVERDRKGKIKGLFACKQPGYAEEFLPDEHGEVIAFQQKHPSPDLSGLLLTDFERFRLENERLDEESKALNLAILAHIKSWMEMETGLSALLHVILQSPRGSLAYAAYYSLNGFGARKKLLNDVICQLIAENSPLTQLKEPWKRILAALKVAGDLRNWVAHTAPIIHTIDGKRYPRLGPLPFDVNEARKYQSSESRGKSAKEIVDGVVRLQGLVYAIDSINLVITTFYEGPESAWEELLPQLKTSSRSLKKESNKKTTT